MEHKIISSNILELILRKLYSWMPFRKGRNSRTIEESGLEAHNDFEVAIGKYNESETGTMFSVGVGNSTQRQNAFEVKETGEVLIRKDLNGSAMVSLQDFIGQTPLNPPTAIEDEFIKALPGNK